jgi:hypothetical protein
LAKEEGKGMKDEGWRMKTERKEAEGWGKRQRGEG